MILNAMVVIEKCYGVGVVVIVSVLRSDCVQTDRRKPVEGSAIATWMSISFCVA